MSSTSKRYSHAKCAHFLVTCLGMFVMCQASSSSSSAAAATVEATCTKEFKSILCKRRYALPRLHVRGGANNPFIEQNPNYVDPRLNQYLPPTLGDIDDDSHPTTLQYQQNQNYFQSQPRQAHYNQSYTWSKKPRPIAQAVQEFFLRLHQTSPTMYHTILSSIILFFAWQLPIAPLSTLLRNHFLSSRSNLRQGRYHTLITSTLSHSTLTHLAMNMIGFYSFGTSILSALRRNGIPLWLYCVMGGIFANALFCILHPMGSCVGFSGVTLSLLALDAKLNPGKQIGFLVHFIPIRLPAHYALIALFVWSLLGTLSSLQGKSDGIAHATHLGGLVYGIVMYELMQRGIWSRVVSKYYFGFITSMKKYLNIPSKKSGFR